MTDTPPKLPLPPDEISIQGYVRGQWDSILIYWKRGWAADSSLASLENYIEFHRTRLFDEKQADGDYDWQHDWHLAKIYHDNTVDFVKNRRAYNDDLKKLWSEWTERQYSHYANISLEALRSMVLINGAAILACLAVLSGQIDTPRPAAIVVAKVTVFTSVVSLLLMATGHAILFDRMQDVASTIRGTLVGNPKHSKLYAIGRYLRRYSDPITAKANYLIYGSIVVFGLSALVSSIILMMG